MQGRLDGQLAGGPAPIGRLALPAGSGTPSIPTPKPPGRAGLGPLLDTGLSVPSAGHASPGPRAAALRPVRPPEAGRPRPQTLGSWGAGAGAGAGWGGGRAPARPQEAG